MKHPNYRSLISMIKFSELLLFLLLWLPGSQAGAQETNVESPYSQDPAITATRVQYPRNSRLTIVRPFEQTEVLSDERYMTSGRDLNTTSGQELFFNRNLPSRTDVVINGQPTDGLSGKNNGASYPIRVVPPSWNDELNLSRNDSSTDYSRPVDPAVSVNSDDTAWPNDPAHSSEWNNPDQTPLNEPADPGNSHETFADGCPKSDSNTHHAHEIGLNEISILTERRASDQIHTPRDEHGAAFYQTHSIEQESYAQQGYAARLGVVLQQASGTNLGRKDNEEDAVSCESEADAYREAWENLSPAEQEELSRLQNEQLLSGGPTCGNYRRPSIWDQISIAKQRVARRQQEEKEESFDEFLDRLDEYDEAQDAAESTGESSAPGVTDDGSGADGTEDDDDLGVGDDNYFGDGPASEAESDDSFVDVVEDDDSQSGETDGTDGAPEVTDGPMSYYERQAQGYRDQARKAREYASNYRDRAATNREKAAAARDKAGAATSDENRAWWEQHAESREAHAEILDDMAALLEDSATRDEQRAEDPARAGSADTPAPDQENVVDEQSVDETSDTPVHPEERESSTSDVASQDSPAVVNDAEQAAQLILWHTVPGSGLDMLGLANELLKDPSCCAEVLRQLDRGDRDEVATWVLKYANEAELKAMAENDEGRRLLTLMLAELADGITTDSEEETRDRTMKFMPNDRPSMPDGPPFISDEAIEQAEAARKLYGEAKDLITENCDFFGCNLLEEDLATALLSAAPDLGLEVLENLSNGNKREVSYSFLDQANDSKLNEIAATKDGKALLMRMTQELYKGDMSDDERYEMKRAMGAVKEATLRELGSEELKIEVVTFLHGAPFLDAIGAVAGNGAGGHTAIIAGDLVFSFEMGWSAGMTRAEYMAKNEHRPAIGQVLSLSKGDAASILDDLVGSVGDGTYIFSGDICTDATCRVLSETLTTLEATANWNPGRFVRDLEEQVGVSRHRFYPRVESSPGG